LNPQSATRGCAIQTLNGPPLGPKTAA